MSEKILKLTISIVLCVTPLSSAQINHILDGTVTTPISHRIPIPTLGLAYEAIFNDRFVLGFGGAVSTGLIPVNGIDGGSANASLNLSIALKIYEWRVGAKYFSQANYFNFGASADDSMRTYLGHSRYTGRQDYIVLFVSNRISDRISVIVGPGIEVYRNDNATIAPEPIVATDANFASQWQSKASSYEAAYHNFQDRYKVYFGVFLRVGEL